MDTRQVALSGAAGKKIVWPHTWFTNATQMMIPCGCLSQVCIFAYGQTGSGKTYTMLGTPDSQGMIPKAMHQVRSCACCSQQTPAHRATYLALGAQVP
jgi:hypothetical protein